MLGGGKRKPRRRKAQLEAQRILPPTLIIVAIGPLIALLSLIASHRVFFYTFFSTIAVSATIANALRTQSNFYSVTVCLAKSGSSVLVLANFGLIIALFCGRLVQQIFFGSLRAVEVERLYDRMWFFVTESLLAFTIFRDEFDIPFAVMFGFLLFVKSFHWLMADRIEWMNQMPYPGPPLLFHIRFNSLFFLLWMTNLLMFAFAVENILTNGVGAIVLFASEYAILMASAMNSMAKYTLSAYDFRRAASRGGENAPPWENKSMWTFYVDLVTDFLKLITYLAFFTIIITFYGVPLNVVRDVYVTARSFITRLRDLIRYRSATRNMDERYPNATEEEMSAMSDRTCIICREEMISVNVPRQGDPASVDSPAPPAPSQDGPNTTPKKLPCGHIFHFHCLRSWLERQQSCPTCRRPVLTATPSAARPDQAGAARGPAPPGGAPGNAMGAAGQQGPAFPFANFVRGLFGLAQPQPPPPPPPPPFVPMQHPPGPIPHNYGWAPAAHMPPPGFAYPPPPVHQLHPPPAFQGFHGPDGVWHPWAPPGQGPNQPVNPAAARASASPGPAAGGANSAQPPTPTRTSSASNIHVPGPSDRGSDPSSSSQPSTPRDAAALAALRRSGSSSSSVQSSPLPGYPSAPTSPPSVGAGHNLPPGAEAAAPSSSTPPAAPNGHAARSDVPNLIPLQPPPPPYALQYGLQPMVFRPVDPNMRPPHVPGHPHQWPQQQPPMLRAPSSPFRPPPAPGHQHPGVRVDPRFQGRPGAPPQSRLPVSLLPPAVSDEQLAGMDRLTRDAIDERLRVLEGVSGAVYRCIEQLTRVRSVLPSLGPQPQTPTQAPSQPASPVPVPSGSRATPQPGPSTSTAGAAGTTGSPPVPLSHEPKQEVEDALTRVAESLDNSLREVQEGLQGVEAEGAPVAGGAGPAGSADIEKALLSRISGSFGLGGVTLCEQSTTLYDGETKIYAKQLILAFSAACPTAEAISDLYNSFAKYDGMASVLLRSTCTVFDGEFEWRCIMTCISTQYRDGCGVGGDGARTLCCGETQLRSSEGQNQFGKPTTHVKARPLSLELSSVLPMRASGIFWAPFDPA
ncbi:hypothetical protein EVG20_g2151 [Dentipellis fragilis]|uniref:RING-type E3 ubiquitin transferase n=1 Tax=Dentipellis fragilis TaxID=205917 RepID=A0A4Y9Z8J1_9AGAM|nr:hypothetical protein EVG20_g2151 [Dentipellis fragilis]